MLVEHGRWRDEQPIAGARVGRCREVLPASCGPGACGHRGHWQLPVVLGAARQVGTRSVGWRCGENSRVRSTAAEARPAGRATVAAAPLQASAHARAGEERTATPGDE